MLNGVNFYPDPGEHLIPWNLAPMAGMRQSSHPWLKLVANYEWILARLVFLDFHPWLPVC